MQLVLAAAVLAALVFAEFAPRAPVEFAQPRAIVAVVTMALVVALAVLISLRTARRLRHEFDRRHETLRRFSRLRSLHLVLLLAASAAIFEPLGWAQIVRFNWRLEGSFLLDEILLLTPILVPLLFSWAAFYEVDRAFRRGLSKHFSRSVPCWCRREYLSFHLRHQLGIFIVPLIFIVAFLDLLRIFVPGAIDHEYGWLIAIPPLGVMLLGFAFVLRFLWRAQPLPKGPLRDRLEAAAARRGFRTRDILVWRTDGMLANAAVAGLVPQCRYVFLTDGLIAQLSEEQVEAVFVHEMGHVYHHHLFLRGLAMLAPLSLWLITQGVLGETISRVSMILAAAGIEPALMGTSAAVLGMFAYVGIIFGGFSRRLEHEADLFACGDASGDRETTAFHGPRTRDPLSAGGARAEIFVSALQRIAQLNGTNHKAGGWQHASIARRVEFLRESARNPAVEVRFRRHVRLLGCLFVGLITGGVLGHLFRTQSGLIF